MPGVLPYSERFWDALQHANYNEVETLLNEHPHFIDLDSNGISPLHYLVRFGTVKWNIGAQGALDSEKEKRRKKQLEVLDLIRLIVDKKPSLLFKEVADGTRHLDRGDTLPFHMAIALDNLEILKTLLDLSSDQIKVKTKARENPAHLASCQDAIQCLKYLLEIDPGLKHETTVEGYNLAHCAIQSVHSKKCLKYLIKETPYLMHEPDRLGDLPIHLAVRQVTENSLRKSYMENVKFIIESNPECLYFKAAGGATPLHIANPPELVAYLIEKDKKLLNQKDAYGQTPSFYSSGRYCDIIYAWYGAKISNVSTAYLAKFIKSLEDKTPLDTRSANCILKYYEPYWPEDLTQYIIMHASPKSAQEILSKGRIER